MTRSKRITPVARIADNKERNAAKEFGKSQQVLSDHKTRLEELIRYRDEYNQRFKESGSHGLEAQKVNEFRIFLNKLNDAINHQREIVRQAAEASLESRESWMHTRTHAKALEKAVERYQTQEEQEQERKDQKETDEQASRTTSIHQEK